MSRKAPAECHTAAPYLPPIKEYALACRPHKKLRVVQIGDKEELQKRLPRLKAPWIFPLYDWSKWV